MSYGGGGPFSPWRVLVAYHGRGTLHESLITENPVVPQSGVGFYISTPVDGRQWQSHFSILPLQTDGPPSAKSLLLARVKNAR